MTRTVRLPIFDEVGVETRSYLELEVSHLTQALYSVPSRVVYGGEVVELVDVSSAYPTLTREELQMLSAACPEEIDTTPTDGEWKMLENLPTKSFEINRAGVIRHKATRKELDIEWDMDQLAWRSCLKINGQDYSLYGKRLAEDMWLING